MKLLVYFIGMEYNALLLFVMQLTLFFTISANGAANRMTFCIKDGWKVASVSA